MIGSPGVSDELALLAGGDEYELATEQINQLALAAKRRLKKEHPFFYNEEYPIP